MTTISSSASKGSAILNALGGGSGIDTGSLVSGLVSATYDPKDAALKAKETANAAKLSQLGILNNNIDTFASALTSLISGGTLATQPSTSDSSILTATAKAGASIGDLAATLEVRQTAKAQSLVSPYYASSADPIGTGKLTIATAAGMNVTVTVDATNNSLAGLARTINSSGSGLTANVVTDANGARLVLKGQTGAANAFSVAPAVDASGSLGKLGYGLVPMALSGNSVSSTYLADASTAPVGRGDLTLTTPNGTATITVGAGNDNLDGLAAAINAASLGVTARVTTDGYGSYLVVDDGNGGAPSFSLAPADGAQAGLNRFAYGSAPAAMTRAQTAEDAIIRMDGIDLTRPTNAVDDVVDGVTLNLVSAQPGVPVTLGATRPTAAIRQAVTDFVDAYNELKKSLDTATTANSSDEKSGALYGNSSVREMQRQLSRLTSTVLSSAKGPKTLAEIGVATNRDGSLSLDTSRLATTLTAYPDAVEAMFNPGQRSDNPLVKITSNMGAAKPGTYTVTNLVAGANGTSASGTIAGVAAVTTGNKLYASVASAASGLVIQPLGTVASATITVDLGLGGALNSIRDALRKSGGVLDSLNTQLGKEKTTLAEARTKMVTEQTAYEQRLTTQFSGMNSRVSSLKSIQSYLEQQVAIWTKSDS